MEQSGAADHKVKRERRERTPEEVVSRFQARIVKAEQQGKWNKVKVLQGLLTHSQSAKIVAVERVTTNKGKGTAGVDKET